MSKICETYALVCLLILTSISTSISEECVGPLGMSDGRIKDSQITESSVMKGTPTPANGKQARLRQNVKPWGAWCPDYTGGSSTERNYDQYIEIDLRNLTTITRIATQGRELSAGAAYAEDYKISYSNYGEKWDYYRETPSNDVKIFRGNTNVKGVVRHELKPSIMARFIRVHPGYKRNFRVCMRLELYGCTVEKVIISYSMPVGQKTRNEKYNYFDSSYNGVISNGFYQGGTGILTDGRFASVNSKDSGGEGWVGWSSVNTSLPYIEIIFQFSGVRKFKDVTLTVNVDRARSNAVFNKSRIFFASTEGSFSKTFLQYCPKDFPAKNGPYNANVTLSLCGNTGSFVKMQLYFRRKWLLITEISFNSDSTDNKSQVNDCSKSPSTTCSVNSPPSVIGLSTTEAPEPGCKSCSTSVPTHKHEAETKTLAIVLVIVGVILFIVTAVVTIFLLHKRRRQAGKSVDEVEMQSRPETVQSNQESENVLPAKVGATRSKHDYAVVPDNDGPGSYEEVQILQPSIYAELDKNRRETNDDNNYQKLLKNESDYVIPNEGQTGTYEEVKKKNSSSFYTALDNTKRDHEDDDSYQKLTPFSLQ
ncbi:discoidin domain-containing receptor 2-like isoform X2 [Dendronephthya gigantea]|nr:discoidin domain-containing receptor 2-like isoform X2 [Dendronephthya gigantea]